MTEEELRKDYYADRPSEPYSDDDRPSDWANIAHYAEENLENAFKRIEELGKENAELKAGKVMNVSTEWHDLRKGPQNLPPLDVGSDYLSKNVLLDTGVIGCYNYSQKKWCVDMGYRLDKPVIAWCEIPKYTEE